MSQENAVDADALAAAITEALNARDVDALTTLVHPDIEFHSRFVALEGRVYKGRDGLAQYFRDIEQHSRTRVGRFRRSWAGAATTSWS